MNTDFPTLIGKFIHHCGVLEFLTNNSIKALSTDPILSSKFIQSSFYNRIFLLRHLLYERSNIGKNEIDTICDELDEIRKQRNIVAHNPILFNKADDNGMILVIRYKPYEVHHPEKLTKKDIEKLVGQTAELVNKISKLLPDSTTTNHTDI